MVLEEPEHRTTVRHHKEPPRNPLQRVGRPFYGAYSDLKKRMPLYLSDIRDGLSPQVLSSIVFIFFASLSPAITFGGMYGELLLFICGMCWAVAILWWHVLSWCHPLVACIELLSSFSGMSLAVANLPSVGGMCWAVAILWWHVFSCCQLAIHWWHMLSCCYSLVACF